MKSSLNLKSKLAREPIFYSSMPCPCYNSSDTDRKKKVCPININIVELWLGG